MIVIVLVVGLIIGFVFFKAYWDNSEFETNQNVLDKDEIYKYFKTNFYPLFEDLTNFSKNKSRADVILYIGKNQQQNKGEFYLSVNIMFLDCSFYRYSSVDGQYLGEWKGENLSSSEFDNMFFGPFSGNAPERNCIVLDETKYWSFSESEYSKYEHPCFAHIYKGCTYLKLLGLELEQMCKNDFPNCSVSINEHTIIVKFT